MERGKLSERERARGRTPEAPSTSPSYRDERRPRPKQSTITILYLALYNAASAGAWAYFAYNFCLAFIAKTDLSSTASTLPLLCWVQTAAVLEILHAAMGLVPSQVFSTTIQIFSRLFVVWIPGFSLGVAHQLGFPLLAVAWTLSDFTRYCYYLLNLFKMCPRFLTWCRYVMSCLQRWPC